MFFCVFAKNIPYSTYQFYSKELNMELKKMTCMIQVKDINKSLEFYEGLLDFKMVSTEEQLKDWKWAFIQSGGVELMLSESDCVENPKGEHEFTACYYFYPDDVEAFHERIKTSGYKVSELEITFYKMKEFSLRDPDGHLLSFGQDADSL